MVSTFHAHIVALIQGQPVRMGLPGAGEKRTVESPRIKWESVRLILLILAALSHCVGSVQ